MESFRDILYPIGFIANICFASRFIYQWLHSEIKQKSEIPILFWKISIFANIIMMIHTIIQLQFSVCLINCTNTVIGWRNINLTKSEDKQVRFTTVLILFFSMISLVILSFVLQSFLLFDGTFVWARNPTFLAKESLFFQSNSWHILGSLGFALFASRFWVQWWQSECKKKSRVGRTFWWLSLSGALLSSIYFLSINDIVNFIGPTFGMLPYIRNLMLIQRTKTTPQPLES